MKLSYAQHLANLANAQKSTGPRTETGKKRASLNALKHGGSAQTLILPGEDALAFARFHHSLKLSLAPANALEESLVASLAQTQWVIDRMRAHEFSLFALGHERFAERIDASGDQVIQTAFAGAKTAKIELESLKGISIYLQRNMRMYQSTLKQLLGLQALRKAEEKATLTEAVRVSAIHHKLNIPFDPREYGFVYSPAEFEFLRRRQTAESHPSIPSPPAQNTSNAA